MNPIQIFEAILNSGRKTTTYKFGLLTSIIDYVIENPIEPPKNNFHFIPLFYLTKQFLAYYFPLTLKDIRQGPMTKNTTPVVKQFIEEFISSEKKEKQVNFQPVAENINSLISLIESSDSLPQSLIRLLFKLRKKIIAQPLKYVQNVKGEQLSLFGLLSTDLPFDSPFHEHRKKGKKLKWNTVKDCQTWDELLKLENLQLFFGHQTFQELSSMRFWLHDVIIKRWAQECIERFEVIDPNLLSYYDFWKLPPDRDTSMIQKYRSFFLEKGLTHCTYCDKVLNGDLVIDHLFPWSKFPVNRFWNLYPVCQSCNSKKSDKLPIFNDFMENRVSKLLTQSIHSSLKTPSVITRDLTDLYGKHFHSEWSDQSDKQLVEKILEFLRNISSDLVMRFPENTLDIKSLQN